MFERRRIKCCILLVLAVMVALHLHLGLFCSETECSLPTDIERLEPPRVEVTAQQHRHRQDYLHQQHLDHLDHGDTLVQRWHDNEVYTSCPLDEREGDFTDNASGNFMYKNGSTEVITKLYKFDIDGPTDVMVFLHMQKTGGTTFGRHLVRDLEMTKPCLCHQDKQKCECTNARDLVWLVSRYTTGWRCGLHADWTELTSCVDSMLDKVEPVKRDRRYMYITILRDPITRYLSEFKHVQRGATWRSVRLQCNGRQASLDEIPFCFKGDDWKGVSLDDFMSCPHNLANNRQTRMMANLSQVGCYRHLSESGSQRQCDMLKTATDNLRKLAFFGLTEYQLETQYMFERMFGLKFQTDFFQYNHTHSSEVDLSNGQTGRLHHINGLDIELYKYAKTIFFQRLHRLLKEDTTSNPRFQDGGDSLQYTHGQILDYDEEEHEENEADDDSEYNGRIQHRHTRLKSKSPAKSLPLLRSILKDQLKFKHRISTS